MNIAIVDDMSEDQVYLEQLLREYAAANQLTMQIDRFTLSLSYLRT